MQVSTNIEGVFNCSLERAFKAPIYGDATKFLSGYLLQPPVIDFEEDANWCNLNGIRYPIIQKTILMRKGRIFTDEIIERNENTNWKWMVYNFSTSVLFFTSRGIGNWKVNELTSNCIHVKYTYTYYSKNILFHPLNWLFVKIQIKGMMKKAFMGIKKQAESGEYFYYELRNVQHK